MSKCPGDDKAIVCNMNNISYYIGKIAIEENQAAGPKFTKTAIKKDDKYPVYSIDYDNAVPGGILGAMVRETENITQSLLGITDALNVEPDFKCIKCPYESNGKVVYANEWGRLVEKGIREEGCYEILPNNPVYSQECENPIEGFKNNTKYKKEIFNLYLLGFGTLMVFLSYKLLLKKN